MQKIFTCPQAAQLEKLAKENYAIPPFLMMENAARAMADFILQLSPESILILCGKGNNGGDGYAVARLLKGKCDVTVVALEPPAAEEAKAQYEMCQRLGICVIDHTRWLSGEAISKPQLIVDCIYGTGFHGELPQTVKQILDKVNKSSATKIACDIPSGLYFQADYTITMGCQKLALYSDKAKAVCGEIIVADLGINREKFENTVDTVVESSRKNRSLSEVEGIETTAYLIEPDDRELPLRKNRAVHKGKFGHTAVLCGDKSGAAILAATAAMSFGSGLTSLVKIAESADGALSDLAQFKISPSLMLSDSIPRKATCLVAGSGFSEFSKPAAQLLTYWFNSFKSSSVAKSPAVVLDAGMLTSPETPAFLDALNKIENARIVLTPHLSELNRLLEVCGADGDFSVNTLAENPEARIAAGNFLTTRFTRTTVIMKSANTYIADGGEMFVIADGSPSLAKGGSGDLLAGLTASLLSQSYTARSAAITAAEHHALVSQKAGAEAYNLTPELFLSYL